MSSSTSPKDSTTSSPHPIVPSTTLEPKTCHDYQFECKEYKRNLDNPTTGDGLCLKLEAKSWECTEPNHCDVFECKNYNCKENYTDLPDKCKKFECTDFICKDKNALGKAFECKDYNCIEPYDASLKSCKKFECTNLVLKDNDSNQPTDTEDCKEFKLKDYSCLDGRSASENNPQCIPQNKTCDNVSDCAEGSDENTHDLCQDFCPTCESPKFRCKTSCDCIPSKDVCNGKKDCPDNSDEEDRCKPCVDGKDFTCPEFDKNDPNSGSRCGTKCDGFDDCKEGSDEDPNECFVPSTTLAPISSIRPLTTTHKANQCPPDYFKCKSSTKKDCKEFHCNDYRCIEKYPSSSICKKFECRDYKCSDVRNECKEFKCTNYNCKEFYNGEMGKCKKFECNDYQCLDETIECRPMNEKCDGIPNCMDGSDEDLDVCSQVCLPNQFECLVFDIPAAPNSRARLDSPACEHFEVKNYRCIDPPEPPRRCEQFECKDYNCIETYPKDQNGEERCKKI